MSDTDDASHDDIEAAPDVTLANPNVEKMYLSAAAIIQSTLQKVGTLAVKPGTNILQLCQVGDALIEKECFKVVDGKVGCNNLPLCGGISFPTSISVNNVVHHFSPLQTDDTLKQGDVVKVDMGVHIDGFCAFAAHTFFCSDDPEAMITGRQADIVMAAHNAVEAASRLIKAGATNTQVTEMISRVAKQYDVRPVNGILSYQISQNTVDGMKNIAGVQPDFKPANKDAKVEKCQFEKHDVFVVDIVLSTGEGKSRELDERCTIFKRKPDENYKLKMKTSRLVFSEMNKKFGVFPFSLRAFDDITRAKLGISECVKHGLVQSYPVKYEKSGDIVARFKYTLLLLADGTTQITGLPLDTQNLQCDHSLNDTEIQELLSLPLPFKKSKLKKKKKPKKKKKKTVEEESSAIIEEKAAA